MSAIFIGFRLQTNGRQVDAAKAFVDYSRQHASQKLLGYLFTTWAIKKEALVDFPTLVECLKLLRDERRPGSAPD
jgi:hypothetical protein